MTAGSFDSLRDQATEQMKWVLVNIQQVISRRKKIFPSPRCWILRSCCRGFEKLLQGFEKLLQGF
jgi:hypothetical protein